MSSTKNWTDDELGAAVKAYLELCAIGGRDARVPKKPTIEKLLAGTLSARSKSSIERRFSNISYVMASIGEGWVRGYKPLSNVGKGVKPRLERLIKLHLSKQSGVDLTDENILFERRVRELRGSTEKMERPVGAKAPKRTIRTVNGFKRSPEVKAYVLKSANGRCEVCSSPAPFVDVDGFPFLEVHHVKPLSEGGSDRVGNAIAVCPNCHRRAHFSADRAAFVESIYRKLPRLKVE
jgi:5-methylcytosine-specific restriction protein A